MKKPQSRHDEDDEDIDYVERTEKTPSGDSAKVRRYPDGSSITYFGPMGGTLYCDENGEEC
jgi:hypothetical protein